MHWLADLAGFAEGFVQNHTYLGAFLVLTACGFGVPLPEEVSIVGMGILISQGQVQFELAFAVCFAGVLAGDAVPYTVGRLWGDHAFEHRWVRRVLSPKRLERLERRFQDHLAWGVFTCRFFPGLRWPGYFIAGHLAMPVWKWLLLDALGAMVMVWYTLYLGRLFGENADLLASKVEFFHLILMFLAFATVMTVVVRRRVLRARAEAEQEEEVAAAERMVEAAGIDAPGGAPGVEPSQGPARGEQD